MSGWTDRIDFPQLSPGWVRVSKPRAPELQASRMGKVVDHMYIAPSGTKFRSIKGAMEYISDSNARSGNEGPVPSNKSANGQSKKITPKTGGAIKKAKERKPRVKELPIGVVAPP